MFAVLALSLACRVSRAPPVVTADVVGAPAGASSGTLQRLEVEGIFDAACSAEGCLVGRDVSVGVDHVRAGVYDAVFGAEGAPAPSATPPPDVGRAAASVGAGPGVSFASSGTLGWWASGGAFEPVAVEGGTPAVGGSLRAEGSEFVVEGPCGGASGAVCATRWTLRRDTDPAASLRLVPVPLAPPVPAILPVTAFVDEAPPVREDAAAWTAAWNLGRARAWRSPFSRVVVAPGGAMLAYFRGPGGGTLVRSPGRGAVRIVAPDAPASWPAWLAMHPTGTEAYLLPWPSSVLVAVDPASLATRWSLPLEAPAHGLFVDPGGRWLLAEVAEGDVGAGEALRSRWTDWPTPAHHTPADDARAQALGLSQAPDPTRDEVVRTWERPPSTAVSVIDLARGEETLRVPGAYRRWSILPDGRLVLATDRSVVIHRPKPPETP